jgi:hypothetical protein
MGIARHERAAGAEDPGTTVGRTIAHFRESEVFRMKHLSIWIACLGLVFALGVVAPNAQARTNVSIGLNFGDRYDGPEPYWNGAPDVAIVPGTNVYYVQDSDYDVYRYGRYWYYNSDSRWYRSRSYRGPWVYVGYQSVPQQIGYVPTQYRRHWRTFRDDGYTQTRYYSRGDGYNQRDRYNQRDGYGRRDGYNRDRSYRDQYQTRDRNPNNQNGDWRDRNRDNQDQNR